MDATLRHASQDLANDLRALLEEIDPARWRDEMEAAAMQRTRAIRERVRTLLDADAGSDAPSAQLHDRLAQLRATLDASLASLDASVASSRASWAAFQREVQPAYEALAASLRAMTTTAPRPLRPTNYSRNVFHVMCGVTVVAMTELLPSRGWLVGIAGAFALWAWTAETTRRIWPRVNDGLMRLFGPVAHAHERHRVNSATWYVTALLLLGALFPRYAIAAGVAVLGLADPAAAIVGRRFGRTKLRAGRSLQGTLAFAVVGTLAAFGVLALLHRGPVGAKLAAAVASASVGALAELYTEGLDDNFTIPLAAAAAAWATGAALGLA